jgi:hypothetical protein
MSGGEEGPYAKHNLTLPNYKEGLWQRIDDLMCGTMEALLMKGDP